VSTKPARTGRRRRTSYHHGDLRAALLRAAEAELEAHGIEAFSLRGTARRAGVSHAAPAHHFADTGALLTALAAEGFRRFLATQLSHQTRAPADPMAQLLAAGEGYIAFASSNPALFRLMFGSRRADHGDADLATAARAAFDHLARCIAALDPSGLSPTLDMMAVWAMAHGIADLSNAGQIDLLAGPGARAEMIAAALRRAAGVACGPTEDRARAAPARRP
jgi:AcrR family transcriptional regulator